ncbi:hypothetical protein KI387_037336 [Taxus chinensis]|uniref:RRM domain-containing protein n=1 Tax=Taxus chinensis TaxID=29808 RepID=A0AA38L5P2_TAXCH|nr:hypothetical protein KI387_037336 [Taxus chinensis]
MVQRKGKTPSKTPSKIAELQVEEEMAAVTQEQVPEEAELNKNADPTEAEADQKNILIAEANERNTVKIDVEETISEKPVSIKKTRKRNADNIVDEPIDVEKVAAQPKVDEIVASEPKEEENGEAKQKNEEDVKAEQKNAEDVKAEQSSARSAKKAKSEQKIAQNVMIDGNTAEKVESLQKISENDESELKISENDESDLKISGTEYKISGALVGEIGKIDTEKSEVGQINTEKVNAEPTDGISKTQMKKLRRRQGLEKKKNEAKSDVVTVEAKVDEKVRSEQKSAEKDVAEKKIVENVGAEKKTVAAIPENAEPELKFSGIEYKTSGASVTEIDTKKSEVGQINTVKVNAEPTNGMSKTQMKKLRRRQGLEKKINEAKSDVLTVEAKVDEKVRSEQKSAEKDVAEKKIVENVGAEKKTVVAVGGEVDKKVESELKNTAKVDAQQNSGLSKTQRKKLKKLEQLKLLEKAQTEQREADKKVESEQKNTAKVDAQQNSGLSKTQQKKLKKLEQLKNLEKAQKEHIDKDKSIGKKETEQKKPEEMDIDGKVQEKTEKIKVNEEDKAKKRKRKSKKRKLENIEKEGQVKKKLKAEGEKKNKKPKTNDVTDAIEMLVDTLRKDEISEILKSAVGKHGDLLSLIEGVADRDPSRRKIYVGNLSSDTTSDMLYKVFSQYGNLVDCRAVMDKDTRKCKGFAFVTFRSVSSALSALKNPRKEINGQLAGCKLARSASSINQCVPMLGSGGFVNPAMLGPGGFVSPAILGSGVLGKFGPPYQLAFLPKK